MVVQNFLKVSPRTFIWKPHGSRVKLVLWKVVWWEKMVVVYDRPTNRSMVLCVCPFSSLIEHAFSKVPVGGSGQDPTPLPSLSAPLHYSLDAVVPLISAQWNLRGRIKHVAFANFRNISHFSGILGHKGGSKKLRSPKVLCSALSITIK